MARSSSAPSRADYLLLAYFVILLVFGLLMLTSAGTAVGYSTFGDRYFFIKRQLVLGVVPGIIAFLVCAKVPYSMLKKAALPLFVLSLFLLFLVFVPGIGSDLNTSARSWIIIAGNSFQPAEFAKIGLIFFMAAYLGKIGAGIKELSSGFLVALGLGSLPIAMVLAQPDVGTAFILSAVLFGLLFIAGAALPHLGGLMLLGLGGLAVLISQASYRAERLITFLHPELDPLGIGYQINQAFLALGSGGWFGLGYNHSRQKFQYLPEVHADSIFAVIGEEMGFFIAAGVVVLLLLIAYRSLRIARQAPDAFGRYLVSGIIIWFMVQSFLNIGAMVGMLPLTGVPLPFVSHGGTALLFAMGAAGLLMNVSRQEDR